MTPPRVVIAAGGPGGHFYPGLALSQELRARGWQTLFIARQGDGAAPALEKLELPCLEFDMTGMPRRFGLDSFRFLVKLAGSLSLAGRVLRDFKPHVVLGMGGYLSFPVVLSAVRRGIPAAVHESNAILGLANRASLWLGAGLLRGLPPAAGEPAGSLTGTPLRPSLCELPPSRESRRRLGLQKERTTVLVFGGSQGAQAINTLLPRLLASAVERSRGTLQVIHLAGVKHHAQTAAAYGPGRGHCLVLPYLEEMADAYASADLVVCRAGASTLAELAAHRKPAVLIPYPHAAAGHQLANARVIEGAGAAVVVEEAQAPARLAGVLDDLLLSAESRTRREAMGAAYEALGLPAPREAAGRLAAAVEQLAKKTPHPGR